MEKTLLKILIMQVLLVLKEIIEELLFCDKYYIILYISCDCPEPVQFRLQDPATPDMEGLIGLNKHVLCLIIIIVCLIGWLLMSTIENFEEFNHPKSSNFYHSDVLEIVWTSIPALTLFCLACPSFNLLYSMDELPSPDLSVKISGHQWFWSYDISDYKELATCNNSDVNLRYVCYLLTEEKLLEKGRNGFFRLLETNKRLLLPVGTHLRFLVTSVDVLHSWTVPSLCVKIDACPGRLNQIHTYIKRSGLFFGQCSEICGVNHGFMPIAILVVPSTQFHFYVTAKLF